MRTQRARSNSCALVQSLPLVSSASPTPGQSQFRDRLAQAETAFDPYRISARITQIDRVIIRAFLAEYCCALTTSKALARTGGQESAGHWLPGGTLPDEFLTEPLPAALEAKLSALPADFERLMIGRDVLLIATATRKIVDVMTNADARSQLPRHTARERRRVKARHHVAQRDAASRWSVYERDSIF